MQRRPVWTGLLQVAVVVRDMDEAVRRYADGYGIGPWKLYTFRGTHRDMVIRDRPASYGMRVALCDLGSVNWELIQPLDQHSIYAEFLRDHGEGVQHVALSTEDPSAAIEHARQRSPNGIGVLQAGTVPSGREGLRYTYLDTVHDLGVVAEVWQPSAGFEFPEPDEVYPPPAAQSQ
jgi:methylmalonyl-CoA/ethylmalonyl-CoA epimerase